MKVLFNSKYKTNKIHTGVDRVARAYYGYLNKYYNLDEYDYLYKNKYLKNIEEQFLLPFEAVNYTFVIHPGNTAPIIKMNAFEILVIHDLAFLDFPEGFNSIFSYWYKILIPKIIQTKNHIVTVSKFSKERIVEEYNIDPENITVIPNGYSLISYEILPNHSEFNHFLAVGTFNKRKNHITIIKAHKRLPSDIRQRYPLRIVGGWENNYQDDNLSTLVDEHIIIEGYINEDRLNQLYKNALALISASKYEGFGLPILEAIARGTIPLVSNIPPYIEILGSEYPLLFESENVDKLANVMYDLTAERKNIIYRFNLKKQFKLILDHHQWDNNLVALRNIIENQNKQL